MNKAMDKTALKNGMGIENVYTFLTGLGISGYYADEHKLVFETCCHNHIGEGSKKLYYYDNTKLFYCFTGCGYFDIFELLSKMNVIKNNEELELEEAINIYRESQGFLLVSEKDKPLSSNQDVNSEYTAPEMNHFSMEYFNELPRVILKDWEREGIPDYTQHKYNVRFNYEKTSMLFPHQDEDFNLLAVRQRLLRKEDILRFGKYRPLERHNVLFSAPSSFYLFGLAHNKTNIRIIKKAIVFEGEKSVMKLDYLLGEDKNIGVAAFGMNFSRHQFEKLASLGVEEIIFAFDRQFKEVEDREFEELLKLFRKIQERFGDNDRGIKLTFILDDEEISGYKDSPVDCGFDVFNNLYHGKRTMKEIDSLYPREIGIWETYDPEEEEYDIYI